MVLTYATDLLLTQKLMTHSEGHVITIWDPRDQSAVILEKQT